MRRWIPSWLDRRRGDSDVEIVGDEMADDDDSGVEYDEDTDSDRGQTEIEDERGAAKPDCTKLRAECDRLKEEAADAELDVEQARASAANAAAACQRARERVTDREAKVADLPNGGEEKPDQRTAEAQKDLRDAQAEVEIICELVEPARVEAQAAADRAAQARADAAAACKAAEDCEAAAG